jgi:hypothetical protein
MRGLVTIFYSMLTYNRVFYYTERKIRRGNETALP